MNNLNSLFYLLALTLLLFLCSTLAMSCTLKSFALGMCLALGSMKTDKGVSLSRILVVYISGRAAEILLSVENSEWQMIASIREG